MLYLQQQLRQVHTARERSSCMQTAPGITLGPNPGVWIEAEDWGAAPGTGPKTDRSPWHAPLLTPWFLFQTSFTHINTNIGPIRSLRHFSTSSLCRKLRTEASSPERGEACVTAHFSHLLSSPVHLCALLGTFWPHAGTFGSASCLFVKSELNSCVVRSDVNFTQALWNRVLSKSSVRRESDEKWRKNKQAPSRMRLPTRVLR